MDIARISYPSRCEGVAIAPVRWCDKPRKKRLWIAVESDRSASIQAREDCRSDQETPYERLWSEADEEDSRQRVR